MKASIMVFIFGLMIFSCGMKRSISEESIVGTYVREASFEVQHPETGKAVGRSTIRDTLFVKESERGFEVRQTKWRLNDFDQQGWQNQQHAENRPVPPYQATFDRTDRFIQPVTSGVAAPLFVDAKNAMLYPGKDWRRGYRKVK